MKCGGIGENRCARYYDRVATAGLPVSSFRGRAKVNPELIASRASAGHSRTKRRLHKGFLSLNCLRIASLCGTRRPPEIAVRAILLSGPDTECRVLAHSAQAQWIEHQTTNLGSGVRISSGAPVYERSRVNRTAFTRRHRGPAGLDASERADEEERRPPRLTSARKSSGRRGLTPCFPERCGSFRPRLVLA
jgi:hypothetical protein